MWPIFIGNARAEKPELAQAVEDFLYTIVIGAAIAVAVVVVLTVLMRLYRRQKEKRRLDQEALRRNEWATRITSQAAQGPVMDAPVPPPVARSGGTWGDVSASPSRATARRCDLERLALAIPGFDLSSVLGEARTLFNHTHRQPNSDHWKQCFAPEARDALLRQHPGSFRGILCSRLEGVELEPIPTLAIAYRAAFGEGQTLVAEQLWTIALTTPLRVLAIGDPARRKPAETALHADPDLDLQRRAFAVAHPSHDWEDFETSARDVVDRVLTAVRAGAPERVSDMLVPALETELTRSLSFDPTSPLQQGFEVVGLRVLRVSRVAGQELVAIGVVGIDAQSETARHVWTCIRAPNGGWKVLWIETSRSWVDPL